MFKPITSTGLHRSTGLGTRPRRLTAVQAISIAGSMASTLAQAPSVASVREYLIIGMKPSAAGEAVTIGSSQEIGADRQTLSGGTPAGNPDSSRISPIEPAVTPLNIGPALDSPNLRSVFFPSPDKPGDPKENRWFWDNTPDAHFLPGPFWPGDSSSKLFLFRGVDWSGDIAVTSASGKFSLQDIRIFGQFGIRATSASAPANVSDSYYYDDPSLAGVLMDSIDDSYPSADAPTKGWDGGYDHAPLLSDLRDWRTFIRNLPRDAFFASGDPSNPRDLVNRNTKNAGGSYTGSSSRFLYDVNSLDPNGDGYAVVDIQFDGTDFEVNNSDWIIYDSNLANGSPFVIFRLRGRANMNMSNASIMVADGIPCDLNGLGALFVKVHPEEEFSSTGGSTDTVFSANNLVVNRVGFWDLDTVGDANLDTDYPKPSDPSVYVGSHGVNLNDDYVNRATQFGNNAYTTLSVQNGQGCGQFISGFVYFQNVRWIKCAQCEPEPLFDLGDLPDTTSATGAGDYQTLLANTGPRHVLNSVPENGLKLGGFVDDESDGQPDPQALGDDDDAGGSIPDDEDGVFIPDLTQGEESTLVISVENAGGTRKLDAFIDWSGDGDFADPDETYALDVTDGDNHLVLEVPMTAVTGVLLGARFRLSTAGGLSPYGEAADGEVEDYLVTIEPFVPPDPAVDWGDLPDSGASPSTGTGNYQTLGIDAGPNHTLATDVASRLRMGAAVDGELDGQPNGTATGDDDALLPDDEDGVSGLVFEVGKTTTVVVTVANAGGGAKLNAFFDWNNDGKFDGTGETITELAVLDGPNNLSVPVPIGAVPNTLLGARFRISTAGGLGPTGNAVDGEVEDYLVTVTASPTAATLAYFRAALTSAGEVNLSWGTLVEFKTLGYRIETAIPGGGWQRLTTGVIPAQGQSLRPQDYTAVAAEATAYRLIEIELDGTERLLATTTPASRATARLDRDGTEVYLRLVGSPGGRAQIQSALAVTGPWSDVQEVTFDAAGNAALSRTVNEGDRARFFRVVE